MKTVYITRNELFKPISMILCNNVSKDETFIEDNIDMFQSECETCQGSGTIEKDGEEVSCDECYGQGSHDTEPYQYFLTDASELYIEKMKEYGVQIGHSESLDLDVIAIYDYGTIWSAFSYSKEVPDEYELAHNETLERTTVY